MAKFKIKKEINPFPEYPQRCMFCTKAVLSQDSYIRHLEFHVKDLSRKLYLVL